MFEVCPRVEQRIPRQGHPGPYGHVVFPPKKHHLNYSLNGRHYKKDSLSRVFERLLERDISLLDQWKHDSLMDGESAVHERLVKTRSCLR